MIAKAESAAWSILGFARILSHKSSANKVPIVYHEDNNIYEFDDGSRLILSVKIERPELLEVVGR